MESIVVTGEICVAVMACVFGLFATALIRRILKAAIQRWQREPTNRRDYAAELDAIIKKHRGEV